MIIEKKLEEEKAKDIGETLPSSEEKVDSELGGETQEIPNLSSEAKPTEEQMEAAGEAPEETKEASSSEQVDLSVAPGEVQEATVSSKSVEIPTGDVKTEEQLNVEKTLTQSQVDEIVGKTRSETRERTTKGFYDRYGVSDEAQMDELVGRSQKYDLIHDDYEKLLKDNQEMKIKLAMYDSNIAPERYEDARLILSGKGLEVTPENIAAELATHPEWKKTLPSVGTPMDKVEETFKKVEEPISTISVLGNETSQTNEQQSEQNERDSVLGWYKS